MKRGPDLHRARTEEFDASHAYDVLHTWSHTAARVGEERRHEGEQFRHTGGALVQGLMLWPCREAEA
jgi:hypothetical protein